MTHSNRFFLRLLTAVMLLALGAHIIMAQPPLVNADSYTMNVNGFLTVPAGGLLANDDPSFSPATHRIEAYDPVSAFGGTVTVFPDGGFTYDPVPAFRGVDTFTYTLRSATGARSATVSITVGGDTVWFVDGTAPTNGDGTVNSPFNSFAPVNSSNGLNDVDGPGDTIFVYSGTYDVQLQLEEGQTLHGQGNELVLLGQSEYIPAGTRPVLTRSTGSAIVMADGIGAHVRGLSIEVTNATAIVVSSVTNFTLTDMDITGTNAPNIIHISTSVSGTDNAFTNVHITGSTPQYGTAIFIGDNTGTINFVSSTVSDFSGGYVFYVTSNAGTITFDADSDLSGTDVQGIFVASVGTGSTTFAGVTLSGGIANNPLIYLVAALAPASVTFTEGITAHATAVGTTAFMAQYIGALTIAGTNSVLSSTNGPALVLEQVKLAADATFASITSLNSPGRGVAVMQPRGEHDIYVTGTTTITNATTHALYLHNGVAGKFTFQTAKLVIDGGTYGIYVTGPQIKVTDNTSTINITAGVGIWCELDGSLDITAATMNVAGGAHAVWLSSCTGKIAIENGSWTSTNGTTNHVVNSYLSNVELDFGGNITKNTAGRAVFVGLQSGGHVNLTGITTATNASNGVAIQNNSAPVTFGTLRLGTSSNRFTTKPITLSDNTGNVNLGILTAYTNGVLALDSFSSLSTLGSITTALNSVLDATGPTGVMRIAAANGQQGLTLRFREIRNPGAGGNHGIEMSNVNGSLTVAEAATIGAKAMAAITISNSTLTATFRSINVDGAFDGIRLSHYAGSFQIEGDGDDSVHTNSMGGTFSNIGDNAFDLTNVQGLKVSDLTINMTGGHAVTGTGLYGETVFSNVDMTNIGNADNENVFNFQQGASSGAQVRGRLVIADSTIQTFADNGLYLENFSDTLELIVRNNTFQNNNSMYSGAGLLLRADTFARITGLIQNNTFNSIKGIGIDANPEGMGTARMDLTITGNTFTAAPYTNPGDPNNGDVGVSLRNAQGNSALYFTMSGNTFNNYTGESALGVIQVEGGDRTTTNGLITGTTINHAIRGDAIGIFADGGSVDGVTPAQFALIVEVANTSIPAIAQQYGSAVYVLANGAPSTASVTTTSITIRNNTFNASPNGGSLYQNVMVNVGDYNMACFNILNNNIAAGGGGSGSIDFYHEANTSTYVQGMAGTGNANAQARLAAANTAAGIITVDGGGYIGNGTCSAPTAPQVVTP